MLKDFRIVFGSSFSPQNTIQSNTIELSKVAIHGNELAFIRTNRVTWEPRMTEKKTKRNETTNENGIDPDLFASPVKWKLRCQRI